MPIQYYMRAYKTTAPTGHVDWVVNDVPDSTGIFSGYSVSDLTNIVVNKVTQSKIENFLKPLNATDGYFFHINSYDWLHPNAPISTPPKLAGISVMRGSLNGITPYDSATFFWDESNSCFNLAYNTNADGYTVGSHIPVRMGTSIIDGYVSIGNSPSTTGTIRMGNSTSIVGRNALNTSDINLIQLDSSNDINIGAASINTIVLGNLEVMGSTTTIESTVVDIADRVIHTNHTTGTVPVPTLIAGLSVHRGNTGSADRDHTSIVWDEIYSCWKFATINAGDDSNLVATSSVLASNFTASSDVRLIGAAQTGSFRVGNNVIGACARNSTDTLDIEVWRTNASNVLRFGTTSFDTLINGDDVTVDGYTINFGSAKSIFVNNTGPIAYLKTDYGAYIDLSGGSSTAANNFAINGSHVDGYVTATNLSTLTNGSNADALHSHSSLGGAASTISVGAYGDLGDNIDGYLISMSVVTTDGYANDSESFPAYVVNSATGTVKRLVVTCSAKPTGIETVTITVRKNWVDTALTVTLDSTMPAGTVGYIATDLVNSFAVVVGDWITVRCISSATCSVQNLMVTMEI